MTPAMSAAPAKRWLRSAGRVFVALCIFAFGVYVVELSFVRFRYIEAARLINSVGRLKIGVTTSDEVRQLSERFGGALYPGNREIRRFKPIGPTPHYSVMVSSPFVSFRDRYIHPVGPGIRFWTVSADLKVENGYLSEIFLRIFAQRADDFELTSELSITKELIDFEPPDVFYEVKEAHVTGPPAEALEINVTPNADADERRKALDFDLRCLISLRECRHACQLSPRAWPDLGERRLHYPDGRENLIKAECEKSLAEIK